MISNSINKPYIMPGHGLYSSNIVGSTFGSSPSTGSLACITYVAFSVVEGEHMKETLEVNMSLSLKYRLGQ